MVQGAAPTKPRHRSLIKATRTEPTRYDVRLAKISIDIFLLFYLDTQSCGKGYWNSATATSGLLLIRRFFAVEIACTEAFASFLFLVRIETRFLKWGEPKNKATSQKGTYLYHDELLRHRKNRTRFEQKEKNRR